MIDYPCPALSFANISVNSVPSVAKIFFGFGYAALRLLWLYFHDNEKSERRRL
jgi:hypothetical protein